MWQRKMHSLIHEIMPFYPGQVGHLGTARKGTGDLGEALVNR